MPEASVTSSGGSALAVGHSCVPSTQGGAEAGRSFIVVDQRDNVATVLDDRAHLLALADGRPCAAGVPFGHKVALAPIGAGGAVIKYGVAIGQASTAIAAGEHVHVHNCR